MDIYFSPISMPKKYTLEVSGDSVYINGVQHLLADLAALSEEGQKPEFVVGASSNSVTLMLPYWGQPTDSVLFPEPLLNVPDGFVEVPS